MEAFFEELLDKCQTLTFLEVVRKKYHYQEEQFSELCRVAEKLLPRMRGEACWNHRIFQGTFSDCLFSDETFSGRVPEGGDDIYSEVVMTLGNGPDQLQEQYMAQGFLTECYMVESLTSELLLQGYASYNRSVASQTAFHVARYHFLGSDEALPLESLPGMLKRLNMPVRCNEAFCMIPKKSVAFVAELTEDVARRCQGICIGCTSKVCPNRIEEGLQPGRVIADMTNVPLSYGYSRIFGRL